MLSVIFALYAIPLTLSPSHPADDKIDTFLIPYLQTIDSVNEETGSMYTLPSSNKVQAYTFLQNYSPEEFEVYLKDTYRDFSQSYSANDTNYICTNNSFSGKLLRTVYYEDYGQSLCIEKYNTTVRLFTRLQGSGSPTRYKYLRVNRVTTSYPSGYTGLHFEPQGNTISAHISDDGKSCTVTMSGYPQDASGVCLTILLNYTLTFYAN